MKGRGEGESRYTHAMAKATEANPWAPTLRQVEAFQTQVLTWFASYGRDLPWRRTRDPYAILVSEIMLQQTQVPRVLPYFTKFMNAFPSVEALACATVGSVLRVWQGLGYNRRPVYLHRSAIDVVSRFGGQFPTSVESLESLSGVGRYTARAVACFAFETQVSLVETNIRKAIHYFVCQADGPLNPDVENLAAQLLPSGNAWTWNQALIDFGAVFLSGAVPSRPVGSQRPSAKQSAPFETSNRYWRGRIVAALCGYPLPVSTQTLIRELPEGRDEYRIRSLLADLESDGLVALEPNQDTVTLASGRRTPSEIRPRAVRGRIKK